MLSDETLQETRKVRAKRAIDMQGEEQVGPSDHITISAYADPSFMTQRGLSAYPAHVCSLFKYILQIDVS